MFTWLKSKQTSTPANTDTHASSAKLADINSGLQGNTHPILKAELASAEAVLEAHSAGQRKAAVQAWVKTAPDDAELARVAKLLQDKDSGAAKLIKEVLAQHKVEAAQTQAWGELQQRAHALLMKPELQAQDAVQLDEAMKAVAVGEQAAVPEALIETCERIALRLQHQAMLQTELRQHVQAGTVALSEVQQRFAQPIQQAQAAWPSLRSTVGSAAQGLLAAQEHKEWAAMPAKLQSQSLALQGELSAAWERFEQQLSVAIAAVDDKAAPLPEAAVWAHELQVLHGAEKAISSHAADAAHAQADEAAKAQRRAVAAAALAEFKLTLTQLERALEQGHTKEAIGQANRLRNLHLADQPPAVQARAHEVLAKTSQLSDWQRWRSDQLREELCVKAEALAAQAAQHDASHEVKLEIPKEITSETANEYAGEPNNADDSISVETQIALSTEEPPLTPAEAEAPSSVEAPAELVDETAAPKKPAKRMSARAIGDTLKALRDEWKAIDKTGEANGILWARFDAACKLAYVPVEAYLAQEKARTQAVEKNRRELLAEIKAWATEHSPASSTPSSSTPSSDSEQNASEAQPPAQTAHQADTDWRAFGHALDQFANRWRNAGHLPEKRFAALQAEWKTAIDAAAAPLLHARADSKQKREAMIARTEALCAAPDGNLQARLRELQAQWTQESKRIILPRHVEQKLWEHFRAPQDAAFNAKRAEYEQKAQAHSAAEAAIQERINTLEAAVAASDEAAIREAGKALEAAWNEYASAGRRDERRDERRDDRRDGRREERRDEPRANPQLVQAQRKAHDAAFKKLRDLAQTKRGSALETLNNAWAARDATAMPALGDLGLKLSKPQWHSWQQKLGAAASAKEADRDAALLKLEVAFEVDSPADAQSARRILQLSLLASRGRDALLSGWPEQVAQVFASAADSDSSARLMACLKRIAEH